MRTVERDILSTAKDICLSQDECSGYVQDCVSLEKNIGQLIKGKQDIEFKLKRSREEFERESKVFSAYSDKMSKHITRTEQVENNLPFHMELARLKGTIQNLKDQSMIVVLTCAICSCISLFMHVLLHTCIIIIIIPLFKAHHKFSTLGS